jgi:pSer/pThr/pTyr-binding forkhead associated (FHA) protein
VIATSVLQRSSLQQQSRPSPEGAQPISPAGASLGIGHANDNDLIVKDPHVSAHHCRLWRDGERLVLEDLSATNGTYVNGERISLKEVVCGDTLVLGRYSFDLSAAIVARLPQATEATAPGDQAIRRTVGRDGRAGKNDIVIDHPEVSRQHAAFTRCGSGWTVKDMGSTHGTFAHSPQNRVTSARVTDKDTVYFGTYPFPVSRLRQTLLGAPATGGFSVERQVWVVGRRAAATS